MFIFSIVILFSCMMATYADANVKPSLKTDIIRKKHVLPNSVLPSRASLEKKKETNQTIPRATSHSITQIPVLIDQPGYYTVDANLVNSFDQAGITIRANNVAIDFHLNTFTLSGVAVGIDMKGYSNISITNANFVSTLHGEWSINMQDCSAVTFNSCTFTNGENCISASNVNSLTFANCNLLNYGYCALYARGIKNLVVKDSFFQGNPKAAYWALDLWNIDGLQVINTSFSGLEPHDPVGASIELTESNNIQIQNSSFVEQNKESIHAENCTGILIEKCTFAPTTKNWFGCLDLRWCSSALIRGCAISNPLSDAGFNGIILDSPYAFILENITIDMSAQGSRYSTDAAGILINSTMSSYAGTSTGVLVKNCIIHNAGKTGILCDAQDDGYPNKNITIEGSIIDGSESGIILSNTWTSTINKSSVKNCSGNGITVVNNMRDSSSSFSIANTISNCSIASNGKDGIYIEPGVDKTLIRENDVFNNAGLGISTDAKSYLVNNILYANGDSKTHKDVIKAAK